MMLQSKCRHSDSISEVACSFCNLTSPQTLKEICFDYISNNVETIAVKNPFTDKLELREGIALPIELCETLLNLRSSLNNSLNSDFINIFRDRGCTCLKRVKLIGPQVTDTDLEILLAHRLMELDITNCPQLTTKCIDFLSEYGSSLLSISIRNTTTMFPKRIFGAKGKLGEIYTSDIFHTPALRKLTLKNLHEFQPLFYLLLLAPLNSLNHLDLSGCSDLCTFDYSIHLTNLTSLVLYNVENMEKKIPAICKLRNLRHLDISQSSERNGEYTKPNEVLSEIAKKLNFLTSLDISGTNLAGRGAAECEGTCFPSDIPGLVKRAENPFEFLGLYETRFDACLRHDIPAKLIAGNANEKQILVAALAYLDRPEMLQKVLNELFHLFRYESCEFVGQALNLVLEAMSRHLTEKHIQISGSATLFYIVKGTIGEELPKSVRVKKKIITTLLNGMAAHLNDDTMMRNGCLTLCQFKIPADVLFEYDRLVEILLHSVNGLPEQESFVQRIGIYLLNSLACQVDGKQKVKLGELGAISKMICLISNRLERGYCDDVLEVAWSMMWNVTDETPCNCQKFLEKNGMEFFLMCLQKFSDKEELLRNMMGLLGNVAEVQYLRHYLITPEYLTVFSELLDSKSDGIEVSYNAAGVISHIASDGPEVWTVNEPSRNKVLQKLVEAISRWDLNSTRNINYRSFEPILYLVRVYHTPECQQWATWALANLTQVYPCKYCAILDKEGGLELLQEVINHPAPPSAVKTLAGIVLTNCQNYNAPNVEQLEG